MALYVDIEKKCGDFHLKATFETTGEAFAILGASGCGKSMTLKCIAGIEKPDKGVIRLDDKVLFDSERGINVPARKRRVGYLFQDYALFPNMTVVENIMCGARDKKVAQEYVKRFYLEGKETLYPSQLSGGQKQRVALARMLAANPDVIMLDEPFSALDNYLKWQLELEIMKVLESYQKDVVLVSHDRNEVYRLTNRIAVMEQGKIVDIQEKRALFENPKTLAATLLTGCKNISRLEKQEDGRYFALDWGIYIKGRALSEQVKYVGVRAHYFETTTTNDKENVIQCKIERVIEDTFSTVVMFRQEGNSEKGDWSLMRYELPKQQWQEVKDKPLFLRIPEEKLIWMTQ